MKMIQTSNKNELMRAIVDLSHEDDEVYINARPSMDIVMNIMGNAPNIQAIYCPPSLLKQTSTKVFSVLEDKGVKLAHKDVKVGWPKKYMDPVVKDIFDRRKRCQAVKDIAKEMDIPLRTVYYYLKNSSL